MTNIKDTFNKFQNICLFYENYINKKRDDNYIEYVVTQTETLNQCTFFKDEYPKCYNSIMDVFNILPNKNNIQSIKNKILDIKSQLAAICTDWLQTGIIKENDEIHTNFTDLITIFDKTYINNINRLYDLFYSHVYNNIYADDISPATASDKKKILDTIIQQFIILEDYPSINRYNFILKNDKGVTISSFINYDLLRPEVKNNEGTIVYLHDYLIKYINNLNVNIYGSKQICDCISYLGWKYRIYSSGQTVPSGTYILIRPNESNNNYIIEESIITTDAQIAENYVYIQIASDKNTKTYPNIPTLPQDYYQDKLDFINLVINTILKYGIDLEKIRYFNTQFDERISNEKAAKLLYDSAYAVDVDTIDLYKKILDEIKVSYESKLLYKGDEAVAELLSEYRTNEVCEIDSNLRFDYGADDEGQVDYTTIKYNKDNPYPIFKSDPNSNSFKIPQYSLITENNTENNKHINIKFYDKDYTLEEMFQWKSDKDKTKIKGLKIDKIKPENPILGNLNIITDSEHPVEYYFNNFNEITGTFKKVTSGKSTINKNNLELYVDSTGLYTDYFKIKNDNTVYIRESDTNSEPDGKLIEGIEINPSIKFNQFLGITFKEIENNENDEDNKKILFEFPHNSTINYYIPIETSETPDHNAILLNNGSKNIPNNMVIFGKGISDKNFNENYISNYSDDVVIEKNKLKVDYISLKYIKEEEAYCATYEQTNIKRYYKENQLYYTYSDDNNVNVKFDNTGIIYDKNTSYTIVDRFKENEIKIIDNDGSYYIGNFKTNTNSQEIEFRSTFSIWYENVLYTLYYNNIDEKISEEENLPARYLLLTFVKDNTEYKMYIDDQNKCYNLLDHTSTIPPEFIDISTTNHNIIINCPHDNNINSKILGYDSIIINRPNISISFNKNNEQNEENLDIEISINRDNTILKISKYLYLENNTKKYLTNYLAIEDAKLKSKTSITTININIKETEDTKDTQWYYTMEDAKLIIDYYNIPYEDNMNQINLPDSSIIYNDFTIRYITDNDKYSDYLKIVPYPVVKFYGNIKFNITKNNDYYLLRNNVGQIIIKYLTDETGTTKNNIILNKTSIESIPIKYSSPELLIKRVEEPPPIKNIIFTDNFSIVLLSDNLYKNLKLSDIEIDVKKYSYLKFNSEDTSGLIYTSDYPVVFKDNFKERGITLYPHTIYNYNSSPSYFKDKNKSILYLEFPNKKPDVHIIKYTRNEPYDSSNELDKYYEIIKEKEIETTKDVIELPKYNPDVKSEFYQLYYKGDLSRNVSYDVLYCDKHKLDLSSKSVATLGQINLLYSQFSRGCTKGLVNKNNYYSKTGEIDTDIKKYIIGDNYDNKTLIDKYISIKNKYTNSSNSSSTLKNTLLDSAIKSIYDTYINLPNGSEIKITGITANDINACAQTYHTYFIYDKIIDEKYFDNKLTYFNNFIEHFYNHDTIRFSDPVIAKYDLSMYYAIISNDQRADICQNYNYVVLNYMKKEYDRWYNNIKDSIGYSYSSYNSSNDKIRQLAEENGDLEQFNKYMDINYNRMLDGDISLNIKEPYGMIKAIGLILNKWIYKLETMLKDNDSSSQDKYDLTIGKNILYQISKGYATYENNDLSDLFETEFKLIFTDEQKYNNVTKLLDNIIPSYIGNYFDFNLNLYQNWATNLYRHTKCQECYKKFLEFYIHRFYNVMEEINIVKLYRQKIDDIIVWNGKNYELNTDITFNLNDKSNLNTIKAITIKDNNNKYCKWKLTDGSIIVTNNGEYHDIDEVNQKIIFNVNMLDDHTLIKKGSVLIDSEFINNINFVKFNYSDKLISDEKNNGEIFGLSNYYSTPRIFKLKTEGNGDIITTNTTSYDKNTNTFIDNSSKRYGDIGSRIAIKTSDMFPNTPTLGHYLIKRNVNYKYPISTNTIRIENTDTNNINSGEEYIKKYGSGFYVLYKHNKNQNIEDEIRVIYIEFDYTSSGLPCYNFNVNINTSDDVEYYIISKSNSFISNSINYKGSMLEEDLEIYDWYQRLCDVKFDIISTTYTNNDEIIDIKYDSSPFNKTLMVEDFNQLMLRKIFPDKFKHSLVIDDEVLNAVDGNKYAVPSIKVKEALAEYGKYPLYLEKYFMNSKVDYKLNGVFNLRCLIKADLLPNIVKYIDTNELNHINYEVVVQGKNMIVKKGKIVSGESISLIGIEINNDYTFTIPPTIIKKLPLLEVIDFQQFSNIYSWIDLIIDDEDLENPQIKELNHSTYGTLKNIKYVNYF